MTAAARALRPAPLLLALLQSAPRAAGGPGEPQDPIGAKSATSGAPDAEPPPAVGTDSPVLVPLGDASATAAESASAWRGLEAHSRVTTGPFGMLERDPIWGEGDGQSYVVPAFEIVGFNVLLNLFNRTTEDAAEYETDFSTFADNLESGWIIDNDPFATNQFLHPYQGATYHGLGRSAGLNYWEAFGYDVFGSLMWETAGETGSPSLNDLITTPVGGSFLGEALFRMANYLLESGGSRPGFYRELGAAVASPPVGFNRLAFGSRFDGIYPSEDPATFTRFGVGARRNGKATDLESIGDVQEDQLVVDFAMAYGLPGKSGYAYERPFDYFQFEATFTSSDSAIPESIMTRGLLVGSKYQAGDSYDGVWGLYGTYDYMSPEVFSVSSTALALGTTGQWDISDAVALQGTLLGGAGWTAVGTIADAEEDRDYSYGVSPQGLLALRLIFGNVAMLDMSARDYYVDGSSSGDRSGSENILRGQASLTVRVYGHHALGLQFVATRRDASFSDLADTFETVGALSLLYTYISDEGFGAVR